VRFDPIWWQAISEWMINISAFVAGAGIGVYFASDRDFIYRFLILTVDLGVAIVVLAAVIFIRRKNAK